MLPDNRLSQPSYDPHGYQPLAIDENCLTAADCREAILEAVDRPCDWTSYLTQSELKAIQKSLEAAAKHKSSYIFGSGEPYEIGDNRLEMAQLGTFRAHARNRYAGGRRIWFGDGVPFQQP